MKEQAHAIVYMVVIAAVFTGGVSGVHMLTAERIALNRELARKRVIMKVLGIERAQDVEPKTLSDLYAQRVKDTGLHYEVEGQRHPILTGLDADGEVVGYAFEVSGSGLWDVIKGYMAVGSDLREIRGVSFYEQNETPGLGSEIIEPWFEQQFVGKRVPSDGPPGARLIRLLPAGSQLGPHDVDAVTGATLTSAGVEACLNEGLRRFLDVMRRREGHVSDSAGR